jgi:dTDP-4-dehydrorhamnose reductase
MNRIWPSAPAATELRRLALVHALGRDTVYLANPSACAEAIRFHRPTAVINAAAYTAVDRAEAEEALATAINGAAPAAMAEACSALRIPLVHISTDYVFDGGGTRPFVPNDATAPQNAYGRSKLAGEQGIRATQSCAHPGCFPPMEPTSSKPCSACQKPITN